MKTTDILNHLEKFIAFRTVIEEGSIRKAAEKLRITQPSLSVKIKIIEEQLGLSLIDRSNRGIIPTRDGLQVIDFINKVIENAEILNQSINSQSQEVEGHIKVGIYDSVARYAWPDFYKKLVAQYPKLQISLTTGRSKALLDQLIEKKIDLAITVEPEASFDVDVDLLYKDTFAFFCSEEFAKDNPYILAKNKNYKLSEKADSVPLILFSKSIGINGHTLSKLLHTDTEANYIYQNVESFELAIVFAYKGIGISLLPNKVAKQLFEAGALRKVKMAPQLPLNFFEHQIGLATHRITKNKPIVELVAKELKQFVKGFWHQE